MRKRELRITPYNCWTGRFLTHLYHHTSVAKDLNIVQYGSMNDAMKDSTDNVWAILEIVGPPGGLDCSFFVDDSDSVQYRDSPSRESVGSSSFATSTSTKARRSAKSSDHRGRVAGRKRRHLINSHNSSGTETSMWTDDMSVKDHSQGRGGLIPDKGTDSMNTIAMQATLSRSGPLITVRMQPSGRDHLPP